MEDGWQRDLERCLEPNSASPGNLRGNRVAPAVHVTPIQIFELSHHERSGEASASGRSRG